MIENFFKKNDLAFYDQQKVNIIKRPIQSYSIKGMSAQDGQSLLLEAMQFVDQNPNIEFLTEYKEVADWLVNNKNKGLILSGECGTGKTTILKAISLIFHKFHNKNIIVIKSTDLKSLEEAEKKTHIIIDEIGAEFSKSNNYGNSRNAIMQVISNADDVNALCIFATNLTAKEIVEKYDNRTLDRIINLCKIVKIEGTSKRK